MYTPPNYSSALSFPDDILSHIHNKLSARHYTRPFSSSRLQSLIGPFYTSPLGTVPKSLDNPSERRIIQDLSFPRNNPSLMSINNQIYIDNFRCDWGTFNDVRNIIMDAPINAEVATLDVDATFRHCPILPSQQPNFVIHWNGLFYMDHNAPFGTTSSGSIFRRVADAMTAILNFRGYCPVKNWVDDFVFFRFPLSPTEQPPTFSYSLTNIYDLAAHLGWPWKLLMTRPFASKFKYLGFMWDLAAKTVQIPPLKKTHYIFKLEPWISGHKFSKKEAESILGILVHCSLALPDGCSHLPSISHFAASFNFLSSPFICLTPQPKHSSRHNLVAYPTICQFFQFLTFQTSSGISY
jgi:hypothetical protein